MIAESKASGMSRRQFLQRTAALGFGAFAVAACAVPVAPGAATGSTTQERLELSWVTPAAVGLERTMYENFALKFQEENPNIRLNVSFEAWGDYMTKLPTMLAGGVIPDTIHQHMSIVQDYAHRGALLDLVPFMERDDVKAEITSRRSLMPLATAARPTASPKTAQPGGCTTTRRCSTPPGSPIRLTTGRSTISARWRWL